MQATLAQWRDNNWLQEHQPSPEEMRDLMRVINRDLADSASASLSPDWRLAIAYNAALQVCALCLAAEGFRAAREQHHHRCIQSLAYTLGAAKNQVAVLDVMRKKRNSSDYERAGEVSLKEAEEMRALAAALRQQALAWLKERHGPLSSLL